MSKKITCDYCNADLSMDNGANCSILYLRNEKMAQSSGARFDFYFYPPIRDEKEKYFCGFGCLEKWISEEKYECTE